MSGTKTQTTTSSQAPYAAAQPALNLGLADAQKAYQSGIGSQPYQGSTVVPYAQQSTQAFGQMQKNANSSQPAFQNSFNQVAANANNGGLNALQQGSVDRLKPMADGSMLNNNPFLDQMISNNSRDIAGASNLQASAAGRYGSGAHQNVTEKNIGDMATNVRGQNYATERGYMQDAIVSLFNAGQQQQSNVNGNNQALQGAYQGLNAPSQTLMDVGGQYEDLFGRNVNDSIRLHNERQQQPWNQIGLLNAIASGAGQMGSTTTAQAQGPSRLSSAAGGALGGYSMFGPLGAAAGGLMGAFG